MLAPEGERRSTASLFPYVVKMECASECEHSRWLLYVPAAVVFASWIDWAPWGDSSAGRAGPYWATAIYLVSLVVGVARGELISAWKLAAPSVSRIQIALGVSIVAFWILAAVKAENRSGAFLEAARVGMTLAYLAFTSMMTARALGLSEVWLGSPPSSYAFRLCSS